MAEPTAAAAVDFKLTGMGRNNVWDKLFKNYKLYGFNVLIKILSLKLLLCSLYIHINTKKKLCKI